MNHCTECGAKRGEEQAFCTECGASFIKLENGSEDAVQQSNLQMTSPPAKSPMSKQAKILLGVAGGLLLVLFGVYQWMSNYYDPVKVLQEMDHAVIDGDSKAFLKHIEFDKKAMLDKEEYFAFIKKYEWETVKPQLLNMMESKQKAPFDFTVKSSNGAELYKVKQKKKLGLFSTYTFRAIPSTLHVFSTMNDTVLTMNKQKFNVKENASLEIEKVYPGTYKYEAKATNLFGDFKENDEFTVHSRDENELYIEFSTETYGIESDQMDATLYVNGKSTEKTLKELKHVGPFPDETEVKMHAEWKNPKGKVMKTKTVTQHDNNWGTIYFEFGYDGHVDDYAFSASTYVLNFRDAYEQALNSKDYSIIASFIEKGSAAEKELKKFINDLDDMEFHYEFIKNDVLDSDLSDDDVYKVTTREKFMYTHYEKGKEEVTDYDREKVYHVKVTDDGYKIAKIDYRETDRNKH